MVTCVSGCFGDIKVGENLTPSFIIFSPFYKLNEEKKIVRDEKKH